MDITEQLSPAFNVSKRTDIDLTIVIPCLNEEENLLPVLDQVRSVLVNQRFVSEIIVIDDMSDDQTLAVAMQWAKSAGLDLRVSVIQRQLRRRGSVSRAYARQ